MINICRFSLILTLLISISGCANTKSNKAYSGYFVQSLNALALPTEKYIVANADKIIHTNRAIGKTLFESYFAMPLHINKPGVDYESNMAIIRNSDGVSLRLGSDSSCEHLVVGSDDRTVCSEKLRIMFHEILFSP